MITSAMGVSDTLRDSTVGSLLASFSVDSFLEFCSSLIVSGEVVESLRGRPLLRFGEFGGFPSSLCDVGCGEEATVLPASGNLGGVLGGRPLFLFKFPARELTLDSVEVVSLPGVSVFLDWFAPLPRLRSCSPS